MWKEQVVKSGKSMKEMSLSEMDSLWNEAKLIERKNSNHEESAN